MRPCGQPLVSEGCTHGGVTSISWTPCCPLGASQRAETGPSPGLCGFFAYTLPFLMTWWCYEQPSSALNAKPELTDNERKKKKNMYIYQFSLVTRLCLTLCDPWTAACQASLSITNSWSLHRLVSVELVMPSNHLILCCPLLLLPSIFPSIRVSSNESVLCIRWPKYWSFIFNISPCNEYSYIYSI